VAIDAKQGLTQVGETAAIDLTTGSGEFAAAFLVPRAFKAQDGGESAIRARGTGPGGRRGRDGAQKVADGATAERLDNDTLIVAP
jgi:hypothetical protein